MAGAPSVLGDEELRGEVAQVVFSNPATGFGVVELAARSSEHDAPRAAGPLADLVVGQPVRLVGRWTEHERYGPTFAATFYEPTAPGSIAGLVSFLASPRFPGVGRTLAQRIVTRFGLDAATVIATAPERLAEVRGVSDELAARIGRAWAEAGLLASVVQRLAGVGLPAGTAQAVVRRFGDDAARIVDEDPYALLVVRGVRWADVEALADGIDPFDPRRLAAGAVAAHQQLRAQHGHLAVDAPTLLRQASRLLRVPPAAAQRALDLARERRRLAPWSHDGVELWYAAPDLAAEQGLAEELARIRSARSRVAPAVGDAPLDPALTEEQSAAARAALVHPLSVVTGGPGTGKTRTVVEIVAACEAADLRVALCAPTGRAAKRLEELTRHGATTVHRLLEAQPLTGDEGVGFDFGYGQDRPLPHDLIVADEWSMADIHLAFALAAAVPDGAHLVLVGDADQLPSVGAGAVLRDLLDERLAAGAEPVVRATRLTHVHRQAATSRIVTLAHEVNAGVAVVPRGRDGDVFAVPERSAGIADRVAEIVAERAPAFFGCASTEVQVLAPMYRGPAGVDRLNARLQERLNPPAGRRPVAGFYEGDRVVQTRNDAELDVANGDIGEVVAANLAERTLEVAFPHQTVTYDAERAGDLRPAWCLTVHKAQGGEWPVVVLILDPSHRAMLWRELVYTALTRAQRGLLLVGDPRLLAAAARRLGSGMRLRRTLLTERLLAAASEVER